MESKAFSVFRKPSGRFEVDCVVMLTELGAPVQFIIQRIPKTGNCFAQIAKEI